MLKSKWGVCAFGILMTVSFMATGTAVAADSCGDNAEARLSGVEKDVADIRALVGQDPTPVNPLSQAPVACSSINLRSAQLHVKCTTSKGSIYERVSRDNFGEAWKGPDGLIWSDRVGDDTQYDAVKTCRNLGGKLPDRAAFERGESNGFREVLPNMKDRYFWSSEVDWTSSPDPERVFFRSSADLSFSPDPAFGYTFSGNYGLITHGRRLHYYTVRCIGL